MDETQNHPALRYIEVGRGYGVTRVPVVTFGNAGRSTMLHIIVKTETGEPKAICGTKSIISKTYEDADPKAVRIAGANVCYRCRQKLGPVPMPHLKTDKDPNLDLPI